MKSVIITKAHILPGMSTNGNFYDFQFESGVRLTLSSTTASELIHAIRSIIDGTSYDYVIREENSTIHIGSEIDYEDGTIWQLVMVPGSISSFQNHVSISFTDREAMSIVDPEVWTKLALTY